jgi:transposase
MPRPKLDEHRVRVIKRMILIGYTQEVISEHFGVKRSTITKIKKGMTDPTHKNARWGDILI